MYVIYIILLFSYTTNIYKYIESYNLQRTTTFIEEKKNTISLNFIYL